MPLNKRKVHVYALLTKIENGFGYFCVSSINSYVQDNNPNKITSNASISASSATINSYPQAGISFSKDSGSINIGNIAWGYEIDQSNNTQVRKIKLSQALNAARELTPGKFYDVEITLPVRSSSPTIAKYLIEQKGRVEIKLADKAIAQKLGASAKSIADMNSDTKLSSANDFVKSRQTTSSINKTLGNPDVMVITDNPIKNRAQAVQDSRAIINKVREHMVKMGYLSSKNYELVSTPEVSFLEGMTIDPMQANKTATIVPIELEQDEEQFLHPETYTRIGYTKLLLPPQAISIRTDNGMENVEILRNQGSLKAVDYNTITQIQISFTAIGQDQYNSVVIPLMQQYNRTPFLPIDNVYLNESWNISAIAIKEFHVETLDSTPEGVAVRIIAEPFAWWQYLPENDSFGDSWCWPLFRAWCEDTEGARVPKLATTYKVSNTYWDDSARGPKPAIESMLDDTSFFVPNNETLKEKYSDKNVSLTDTEKDPINGYTLLTDDDAILAYTVSNRIDLDTSSVYKLEDGRELITLWLEGQFYALVRFKLARNILKALQDSSIRAYSSYNIVGSKSIQEAVKSKNFERIEFFPEGGIGDFEKLVISRDISALLKENGNSSDIAYNNSPYFLIPRNSSIWEYVVQRVRKGIPPITIADMNGYRLSSDSVISNISIQFTTNLATQQVQQESLPKHQYIGSGDAFVSIQGTLVGEEDVALLNNIVEKVRNTAREWRPLPFGVPYAGFMFVNNTIINTLGLSNFIPLSLSISTMEGYPHTYTFQLDLMEFRPAQKNREEFEDMDKEIIKMMNDPSYKGMAPTQYKSNIPENIKKILERNATNIGNPIIERIDEEAVDKIWRSSIISTRLRMMELYPDMHLPSKKKLDNWIRILKYFFSTGLVAGDQEGERYLASMLKGIDLSKDNLDRINLLQPSGDLLGYVDPDFYCVPAVDPREWAKKMIDINFGDGKTKPGLGNTLCYDDFGAKFFLAPGKTFEESEPANNLITDKDAAFRETEKLLLQGYFNKVLSTKINTANIPPNTIGGTQGTKSGSNTVVSGSKTGVAAHKDSAKKITVQMRNHINNMIAYFPNVKGLNEGLIAGIILRESDANPNLVNEKGYIGLMQLNSEDVAAVKSFLTTNKFNKKYNINNLKDPMVNLTVGIARIAGYLERYNGDVQKALWAHVAGTGRVASGRMSSVAQGYVKDVMEIADWWNQGENRASLPSTINDPRRYAIFDSVLKKAEVPEKDRRVIIPNLMSGIIKLTQVTRLRLLASSILTSQFTGYPSYQVTEERLNPGDGSWSTMEGPGHFATILEKDLPPGCVEDKHGTLLYNYTAKMPEDYTKKYEVIKSASDDIVREIVGADDNNKGADNDKISKNFRDMFKDLENKSHESRLVGAFPAYLVVIVDGGRWVGVERIWDHMYGSHGVSSIDIVQSRKDPVDVATITFSNLYGKLTSTAASIDIQKKQNTINIWHAEAMLGGIQQFFSGRVGEDLKRRWSQWVRAMMIRPGARLHIRLGYGCADEETEILTSNGWCKYTDLKEGDTVLTLNHSTGKSEWQQVSRVNIYDVEDEELLYLDGPKHSSLTTLDHKWPVINLDTGKDESIARKWTTSKELLPSESIPVAAVNNDLPKDKKYSDELVELVGWFIVAGTIKPNQDRKQVELAKRARLSNESRNRISHLLEKLFGPISSSLSKGGPSTKNSPPRWTEKKGSYKDIPFFCLSRSASKDLLEIAPRKIISSDWIKELTLGQLEILLRVIAGKDLDKEEGSIIQKEPEKLVPIELACILAGKKTNLRQRYNRKANCLEYILTFSNTPYLKVGEHFPVKIKHTGIVWCPTTPNGTWFARRRGTTYYTGNSDASKYPVKFNGVISEVPVADRYCQVIALGDAIELMKPFPDTDSYMIYDSSVQKQKEHNMFQNTGIFALHGKEPRNIIGELFRPSWDLVSAVSAGRWQYNNPYGISHFGSLDYSIAWSSDNNFMPTYSLGEIGVNLYNSKQDPDNNSTAWQNWLTVNGMLAHLQGQTLIGVQIEDASPWKVIETCRKAIPDFIAAVRPFDYRSTLFFGKSSFPFYYKYKDGNVNASKLPNDNIEKYMALMDSKTFSQIHIICSGHNLIASNIIATDENVITNCQSKYIYGGAIRTVIREGDIMKADSDIFPEHQKTIVNNSGLLSGTLYGLEGIQSIANAISFGNINTVNTAANTTSVMLIRDSLADMYQGGSIISGDPYIFPWDYVYLIDASTLMNGLVQVKEVTNHFSLDAGYITVVSPDCLVATAGHVESSMWFSLARIGYSYASYRIWRYSLGHIIRRLSNSKIKSAIVGKAAKLSKNVTEKDLIKTRNGLLKAYESIKNKLKSNGVVVKTSEFIEKYAPEVKDMVTARVTANQWGNKIYGLIKKAEVGKHTTNIINYAKTTWASSKAGKKVAEFMSKEAQDEEAVAAAAKKTGKAVKTAAANKAGKAAKTVKAAEVVKGSKKAKAAAKGVASGAKGAIDLLDIAAAAVGILLTSTIGDTIGRWLSSSQSVVIMPLKVNDLEFSAGIEGHMGAVIGDPISTSDWFWASILSSADKDFLGSIVPFLADLVFPGSDSGWNPNNPEENNMQFPKIPEIQEDNFNKYIDKLNETINSTGTNTDLIMDDGTTGNIPVQPITKDSLFNAAKSFEGKKYVYGGDMSNLSSNNGLDCSGFVQAVFKNLGRDIPRTANVQYKMCTKIQEKDLKPGDLVFKLSNGIATHVGIYAGDGMVMEAPHTGSVVVLNTPLRKFNPDAYGRL
jgi:hypothetical protein